MGSAEGFGLGRVLGPLLEPPHPTARQGKRDLEYREAFPLLLHQPGGGQVAVAQVALARGVTGPQLDAGDLRTVDKSFVQEEELVGAICLYQQILREASLSAKHRDPRWPAPSRTSPSSGQNMELTND